MKVSNLNYWAIPKDFTLHVPSKYVLYILIECHYMLICFLIKKLKRISMICT
uniref:Uncharacterized protein n=1 Tax=Solanum lycopersicum TaxID=4081 RepID=A0A3Q7HJ48_SOLLC